MLLHYFTDEILLPMTAKIDMATMDRKRELMMTKKIGRVCGYFMLLPLALLSVFIYKLALQPAIHAFYEVVPNLLQVSALVIIAALVHAVLLATIVLKYYTASLRITSVVMSVLVLIYCVQMSWLSPLVHLLFWLGVFLSYVAIWAGILKIGLYFMVQDHEPDQLENQSVSQPQSLFEYRTPPEQQT